MRRRLWLPALSAGLLMLAGVIATDPLAGSARQDATPPAQTTDDDDQESDTPVLGTPLFRPTIDLIQAQEIALSGQAGAAVIGMLLDGGDGVLVYEVMLDNGIDVEVDATTGAVLETEQRDGEGENDDENGDDDDSNEDDEEENEEDAT